ncbi:hypothetical protein RB653_009310 [Dictyostelium firmibasis]|uniref:Uncharacterized protein n=1 Tax=Dictyostelium firmibasis TaxID=79012 RepID=A0AAN7U1Q0_9MYCE
MGKFLTNYYKKIFNSPHNFDDISSKKTKNFLMLLCFLGLILWIIIIIIAVKDSLSRLTFMTNEIENEITIPSMGLGVVNNISQFAINQVNSDVISSDIDFSNGSYCLDYNDPLNKICKNNDKFPFLSSKSSPLVIRVLNFNLTFEKQYFNLDVGQKVLKKNSSVDMVTDSLIFIDFNGYSFNLYSPIDFQIMVKKTKRIDRYQNEYVNFIPSVIGSGRKTLHCTYYPDTNYSYRDCLTTSISVIYESNIVSVYREETNLQLFKRILKDIFSIGKLVLTIMSLIIIYYQRKFLFTEQTARFDNSIRDAVLYHFNIHELNPADDEEKPPGCFGRLLNSISSKIKKIFCCCGCCGCCETQQPVKLSREQKIQKETKGSNNPFFRLFQGIPNMDSHSFSLGIISNIKWGIVVVVVIIYGVFIGIQDWNNRLIILKLDALDQLEVPDVNFVSGYDNFLMEYQEYLPSGQSKQCKIDETLQEVVNCTYSLANEFNYPNSTLSFSSNQYDIFSNVSINNGTVLLKDNQYYRLTFKTRIAIWDPFPSFDHSTLTMNINGLDYNLRTFSNNTVQLEKSVYHYSNGTSIISYNPKIFQSLNQMEYIGKSVTPNYTLYDCSAIITFFYSSTNVKHIFIEGNRDLGLRVLSDIGAFYSPVSIFITLFFSYLVVRFANKDPTTHVEPSVREAILYHMKYFDRYSKKFKKEATVKK